MYYLKILLDICIDNSMDLLYFYLQAGMDFFQ